MLVSVVIPTFNRALLVERAVHSALAQTYHDIEVIVVDDASSDNTRDIIESLKPLDHRLVYIRHETNQGAQAARNTGIQNAKGNYVAFLDSDDEWLPHKIDLQMALFTPGNGSPGAIYCGLQQVTMNGKMGAQYLPKFRGYIYPQALRDWIAGTDTLIVSREILKKIHGFNENIRAYHEWDLCIRLAKECAFDFVPDCLTLYHEHALPTISKDFLRDANGYLDIVEMYRTEIMRECGRRTLSEHYLKTGRLFVLANQFHLARAYFLKSIRYDPLNIKAIIHFMVSLLGIDAYTYLRLHRQNRFFFSEP